MSPSVLKMERIDATGSILFLRMYLWWSMPCIYVHAKFLLLCPLSVKRYNFTLAGGYYKSPFLTNFYSSSVPISDSD